MNGGKVQDMINRISQIDVHDSPTNKSNIGWKHSSTNKSSDSFPYDAVVRYSYIPQENDELSLTPGEIIKVLDKGEDNGWLYGSINGVKGVFPDSYIEKISDIQENIDHKRRTPSESGSTTSSNHYNNISIENEMDIALVAFDYTASRDDELTLKKGDKIQILDRNNIEEGWFKGKHLTTNRIGVFPANFTKYREQPINDVIIAHRKPPMPAPNSSAPAVIPPALPQKPKSVSTLVTQLNSSSSMTSLPTSSLSTITPQQNMTTSSNISNATTMTTTQDNSNAILNTTNGCMNNSSNVSRCLSPSKDINNQSLNADCIQSSNNNNKSPDNISNMSHSPGSKMNRISSPLDGVSVADRRNLIGSKLKFDPMNAGRFSLGGGMMTSLNTTLGHDQSSDGTLPSPGGAKYHESLPEEGGLFDSKPTAKLIGPTVNRIKPVGKRPPSAMFIKNRYTAIEESNTSEIDRKSDKSISHTPTNLSTSSIGSTSLDNKVILRTKSPTPPQSNNDGYVTRKEYNEKVNQLVSEIESLKSRIKDLEMRK
uniref:SH3 domain-containing protein n=1 Tax=Strongyloides papillosus TaxID=174720 RepID=A0A0N5BRA8_STREA